MRQDFATDPRSGLLVPRHALRSKQRGWVGGPFFGGGYADIVLADRPLIYYRMNESSGTTLTNLGSLGSSFNGTTQGSPTLGATGLISGGDKAISFDGVDDVVYAPESATLGLATSTRSLEFWFKTSTSSFFTLCALRGTGGLASDEMITVAMNSDTTHKLTFRSGGLNVVTPSATVDDGAKHHVWVALTGGTNWSGYLDGASLGSGSHGVQSAVNLKLAIGSNINAPTTFFQFATAVIDEVAVYDFVPSSAKAITHFTAGL